MSSPKLVEIPDDEEKVNKLFGDYAGTNTTVVAQEGVLFYISDFYLKAASSVFRDIFAHATPSTERPSIPMDESSDVVEGLLYATCHSPAEVVAHLSKNPKDILEALAKAVEKYGMETHRSGIRLAIIKKWDFSRPVDLLENCAWWRDPATIAIILEKHILWSSDQKIMMQPWMLPAHIVSDMGVQLYRMLVEACVKSATLTNNGNMGYYTCTIHDAIINWDGTTSWFVQSTNDWEGSF